MAKRTAVWAGALGLLLVVALLAVMSRRIVGREFHRLTMTAAAAPTDPSAVTDTGQAIEPRDPNFLAPQRLDAWQIIGPGGGGNFYNLAISPHDPNLVFGSTEMRACYVSENGGRTWRTFNLRWTCSFVFDPKLPDRVYALARALWRSDDRGHTWSLIYPAESSAEPRYADDEAELALITITDYPHSVQGVSALAVDPDDSNSLYASLEGELKASRDAGKTWKTVLPDGSAQQLWVDPNSPREKRTIYTRRSTIIGVWDGVTYVKRPVEGLGEVYGAAFGIRSGGGKPVIYIACDYLRKDNQLKGGGILASDDGGQTWRSLNEGLLKLVAKGTYPEFTALATSRNHAEVIYAGFQHLNLPNDQKRYFGVLKTSDGGVTWVPVRQESNAIAANMHNDWTSIRFGPYWAEEPLDIAADDNNPDLSYTGDNARVMRSADGGKNWFGVFSQSTGKGYTTTGLDVTTCYGIHFDPFDPKRMFISYTDIGLMRSEDGGESWLSATTKGVPKGWQNNTYWMEFDPAVKGKMWAVMSSQHDLPRTRELKHWGSGDGGVAASVDGGDTWTAASHGLPPSAAPTHILLDPKSPVTARVLYLASFGRGIYKSTDGGQNWAPKNAGLPEKDPLTWRMALAGDGTLYVVTIRRSIDGKYGNENDGWLFRSRNGADSWERVPLPEGVNGPVGITVDPRDPAHLYLSAWARFTQYSDAASPPGGGVYMSTDAGGHWQNVLNAGHRIGDVTMDPRNSDLVYAVGFEPSAWRSADRGKTWNRIGGYNFKDGQRVIPDPTDINKIYIATFGNSVWHGPAAGDPKATEDITSAPPAMKFQFVRQ
jgi:photosystem II stability/assembly factor-like uncharacterized protein